MRNMLIAIDGTGVGPWELSNPDGSLAAQGVTAYDNDMRNSFIRQLVRDYRGPGRGMYFRGPTLTGSECSMIAGFCMTAARVSQDAKHPIHLAGYSRGGAIAIEVARRIRLEFPEARIPVMALFDAVDREREFADLTIIPGNVDFAFHARRDQIVHSRDYFSNCGTMAEPPCKLESLTFVTTHGGMGGVPTLPGGARPDLERYLVSDYVGEMTEGRQSSMVHDWMWANLRKKGIVL
jgi:hypothetical protein